MTYFYRTVDAHLCRYKRESNAAYRPFHTHTTFFNTLSTCVCFDTDESGHLCEINTHCQLASTARQKDVVGKGPNFGGGDDTFIYIYRSYGGEKLNLFITICFYMK
jgi:hypothetical protein